MLYFDQNANFYAKDASILAPFQLHLNDDSNIDEITKSISLDRTEILTDGLSYFVVPKSVLTQTAFPKPPDLDIDALQTYFFSEDAVAAALEITPEALDSLDKGSLTYGTTGATSLFQALERIAAGPSDRFLDIGCGCGLPVVLASHLVEQAKGVDLIASMIAFAQKSASFFRRPNTKFLVENIRDLDISDIDIVYVAATTLTQDLRKAIGQKLSQLRPGAVVVSLTYSFDVEHLVLVDSFKSPFSWWQSSEPTEHRFLIHLRKAS